MALNINHLRLPESPLFRKLNTNKVQLTTINLCKNFGEFILETGEIFYRKYCLPSMRLMLCFYPKVVFQEGCLFTVLDTAFFNALRVCMLSWNIFWQRKTVLSSSILISELRQYTPNDRIMVSYIHAQKEFNKIQKSFKQETSLYKEECIKFFLTKIVGIPFLLEWIPIKDEWNRRILILLSLASLLYIAVGETAKFKKKMNDYRTYNDLSKLFSDYLNEDLSGIHNLNSQNDPSSLKFCTIFSQLAMRKCSQPLSMRFDLFKMAYGCIASTSLFFLKVAPLIMSSQYSLKLFAFSNGFTKFIAYAGFGVMMLGLTIFFKEHPRGYADIFRKSQLKYYQICASKAKQQIALLEEKEDILIEQHQKQEEISRVFERQISSLQDRFMADEVGINLMPEFKHHFSRLNLRVDEKVNKLLALFGIRSNQEPSLVWQEIRDLFGLSKIDFIKRYIAIQNRRVGRAPQ